MRLSKTATVSVSVACGAVAITIAFIGFTHSLRGQSKPELQKTEQPVLREVVPIQENEILATVGGEAITTATLRRAMIRNAGEISGRFATVEQKEVVLKELIGEYVLAALARQAGYAEDPDIKETITAVLADRYLRQLSENEPPQPPITDLEVREFYERHKADYAQPERARASIIFLKFQSGAPQQDRADLRRRASELLRDAQTKDSVSGSFAMLVKQYSDDPETRQRGGDIGWLPRGAVTFKLEPQVVDAIFLLSRVGQISPIVETPRGLFLVQLTDRDPGGPPPLEQMAGGIRAQLAAERTRARSQQRIDDLSKQFQIQVHRDVLASVVPIRPPPAGPERPPSFPIGDTVQRQKEESRGAQ